MICQATFIVSPSTAVNIARVLLRLVQDLAVVRDRHPILAVAEHVARPRILLHAQAVHRRLVRQLDDLVALHHVETDAADARVRLVVGEEVAPVVGAVGEGRMRMVQVAVGEGPAPVLQELAILGRQAFGEDLQALVGLPPAGGAVAVEHRDAHQLAHRGQADDADLAGLAAGEEHVVLVELAGFDLVLVGDRGPRRGGGGRVCASAAVIAPVLREGDAAGDAGRTGSRNGGGRAEHVAPAQSRFLVFVRHLSLLFAHEAVVGTSAVVGSRTGLPMWVMTGLAGPCPRSLLPRIDGDESASRFSRFSRTWIMCGQRWSSWYSSWQCMQ